MWNIPSKSPVLFNIIANKLQLVSIQGSITEVIQQYQISVIILNKLYSLLAATSELGLPESEAGIKVGS